MEILNAASEKLYDSLEDNYDAKKELLMKCETLECEHSNTLRKVNERISEMKQEIGSYLSKRSGRDSQGKKSNGSSVASSLIKRTAIAASFARLKTELKFADAEARKTSALKKYEDELKKFKLEKELALAKAEMEAVIKTEDEESENFVEDKNLPKEIDKNYVLQNYFGNCKAVSFNISRFIETRRLQPLIYSEKNYRLGFLYIS